MERLTQHLGALAAEYDGCAHEPVDDATAVVEQYQSVLIGLLKQEFEQLLPIRH